MDKGSPNSSSLPLNPSQKEAVEHTEGAVLVLAGAGSGKTRVITSKIISLLEKKLCHAGEIMAITFTNKAADEMKSRIHSTSGVSPYWVCTFHRMGSALLRRTPAFLSRIQRDDSFTILDNNAQLRIIRNLLKSLRLDSKKCPPPYVRSMIRAIKSTPHLPEDLEHYLEEYLQNETETLQKNYRQLFHRYQQLLKENNSFDFDDLLLIPYQLFASHPEICDRWSSVFHYMMVDEFQDTNTLQYELIRMLGKKMRGITVVGDDDQTIYSWRGAVIENFVRFQTDFSPCHIVKLEENYRSHEKILRVANSITESIEERYSKVLYTSRKEGVEPVAVHLFDEREEGKFVAERILALQEEKGFSPDEFAVFCRTNWQFRTIEDYLRQYKIPYQVIGNIKFYERKEIRILLDYLQFIVNPENRLILRQIINTPSRFIGERTWQRFAEHLEDKAISITDFWSEEQPKNDKLKKVYTFLRKMKELHEMSLKHPPSQVIEELLHFLNYYEFITAQIAQSPMDSENRQENVKTFKDGIEAREKDDPDISLKDYIEELSLLSDADEIEENSKVHLMTMHCAKGLEYSVVLITGLEEGILPHHRSMDEPAAHEEEKRLFYVAVTRAKELLYITSVKQRQLFGNFTMMLPSGFLNVLPREEMEVFSNFASFQREHSSTLDRERETESPNRHDELEVGEEVLHPQYGRGLIVDRKAHTVKVRFDDEQVRTIFPDMVALRSLRRN